MVLPKFNYELTTKASHKKRDYASTTIGMAARILGSRLKVLGNVESSLKSACGCVRFNAQSAALKDESVTITPITKVLIANRGELFNIISYFGSFPLNFVLNDLS